MTEIILDDIPLFGEIQFDRTKMQNQIDVLERRLAQAGRVHEGLINDLKDEHNREIAKLEAFITQLQSRIDPSDSAREIPPYDDIDTSKYQRIASPGDPIFDNDITYTYAGAGPVTVTIDPPKFGVSALDVEPTERRKRSILNDAEDD